MSLLISMNQPYWGISANLRQNPCAGEPLPFIRAKMGKRDLHFPEADFLGPMVCIACCTFHFNRLSLPVVI